MSLEFDNPTNLDEMRQIAHDWLDHRPTIAHTRETLRDILRGELGELYRAIVDRKDEPEITMEAGDVLFSMLAIDDASHEFDRDYKFFTKYAESLGSNIVELFKKVHYKNRVNYPITFFNQMSPFINPADAISCLRILRSANRNDPAELDDLWFASDSFVNDNQPCFFDRGHSNYLFRKFIKTSLNSISRKTKDPKTKDEIKRLRKIGFWGYSDLPIPNNHFNWYRLT